MGRALKLWMLAFLAITLVVPSVFLPSVAVAQSLDIAAGSGPIDITADNGIEWDSPNQVMTAHGNAVAKRGGLTVYGDTLVAHYIKIAAPVGATGEAQNQIQSLEAHGNVRIVTPTQKAEGRDAIFRVQEGTLTLLGEPVTLTGNEQVVIAQHRLDYDTKTQTATASQGATISQKGRTISAPVIIARMVTVDGKTTLHQADGTGGVAITTETETAYGSQGNYDAKTGIVTLTDQVRIKRGGDVFTGTKGIFNLNTNVSRLLGGSGQRATAFVVPAEKSPPKPDNKSNPLVPPAKAP